MHYNFKSPPPPSATHRAFSWCLPEHHVGHSGTKTGSQQHPLQDREQTATWFILQKVRRAKYPFTTIETLFKTELCCGILGYVVWLHVPYLAWWSGSSSYCTAPQPATSHGETRGPWSSSGSTVCAWAHQTSAPGGTWCHQAACGFPGSFPLPGSSSSAEAH